MTKKAIAVFDSGFGGISVLSQLKSDFPHEDFIYFGDSKYAPYGIKTKEEIFERCKVIMEYFIKQNTKAVVIACNTATSACARELRELYSDLIIIGMEPALKPAIEELMTPKKVIVLATNFTLNNHKFKELVHGLNSEDKIIPLAAPKLVEIIEEENLNNKELIKETFDIYFKEINMDTIDTIVLGCTHFVFYKKYLKERFPNIKIIDGNLGTSKNLKRHLLQQNLLELNGSQNIDIHNSKGTKEEEYSLELLKHIELKN